MTMHSHRPAVVTVVVDSCFVVAKSLSTFVAAGRSVVAAVFIIRKPITTKQKRMSINQHNIKYLFLHVIHYKVATL